MPADRNHLEFSERRNGAPQPRRVAIRLWDWSDWSRKIIRGAQRFAHEQGDWKIYVAVGPAGMPRVLHKEITWDGIITGLLNDVKGYQQLLKKGETKVVALTAAVPTRLKNIPAVRVDDDRVANVIGNHLLRGGFRHLGYSGSTSEGIIDNRGRGLVAFAERNNLKFSTFPERWTSTPAARRSLRRWVATLETPVGIVTWNIDAGRQVVEALQQADIAIPEQAAVVAWDDDVLIAETLEPTISAVVIPAERLGYESARLLSRLMNGEKAPDEPILIEPSGILHVRQSSDVSRLQDRVVYLAHQYIREHDAEPIRIEDISDALFVSRRKLEQDFRRVTGRTLHEAITAAHMERAKQYLIETDWPADRVAKQAGLGTKQTLHRQFTTREGMTPAEYRSRFGTT